MRGFDESAANDWLMRYGNAWERADPAAAAVLFSPDCRYFETPFSEPAVGRDGVAAYWSAVPEGQAEVRFAHHLLAIQDRTVLAHWSAAFRRRATGVKVELDGMFALTFDDAGLCRELREWWHRRETPTA